MQSGTIVRRNAKTFIPNAYLEAVLKANPHGWGAATVSEVDGVKFLELNAGSESAGVEFFQETMKTFPDQDITFYFASSEVALSDDDLSPYILLAKPDEEDSDLEQIDLVVFIEGNFPGSAQAGSSHPPEYHLVEDVIRPKFENLYEMLDGDLDKLMENLKKPHFKKELLLNSVSRGTFTFVASNGESITFDQNDKSGEFPWGWVSNTHGYTEGTKQPEVPAKKRSAFPSRSTVREAPPSAAIAAATVPSKTETAVVKNYTTKKERPPAHLSRKDKKGWYKSKIGYTPKGWENGVQIDVFVDTVGKVLTFSQVKALGLQAVGLPQTDNPEPEKDTGTENIPHEEGTTDPQVTADILPIMNPTTRKNIAAMLKETKVQKTLAENADRIADPKQIQAIEAKFANFAAQMGMNSMDELGGWSDEMIDRMCKSDPNGAFVLIRSLLNEFLKRRAVELKKVEAPAAAEVVEAPAPKKSMFPSRRNAA